MCRREGGREEVLCRGIRNDENSNRERERKQFRNKQQESRQNDDLDFLIIVPIYLFLLFCYPSSSHFIDSFRLLSQGGQGKCGS